MQPNQKNISDNRIKSRKNSKDETKIAKSSNIIIKKNLKTISSSTPKISLLINAKPKFSLTKASKSIKSQEISLKNNHSSNGQTPLKISKIPEKTEKIIITAKTSNPPSITKLNPKKNTKDISSNLKNKNISQTKKLETTNNAKNGLINKTIVNTLNKPIISSQKNDNDTVQIKRVELINNNSTEKTIAANSFNRLIININKSNSHRRQTSNYKELLTSNNLNQIEIFSDFNSGIPNLFSKDSKICTNIKKTFSNIEIFPLFDKKSIQFEIKDILLGQGTFGNVYKIVDKINQKSLALKLIEVVKEEEKEKIYAEIINEIQIMEKLKEIHSDNIILIESVFRKQRDNQKTNDILILLELCDCNLQEIIDMRAENSLFWSESELLFYYMELYKTLRSIHSINIAHRDIKPKNILYKQKDSKLKFADFGESKYLQEKDSHPQQSNQNNTIRGTPFYMSPEIFSLYKKHQIYGSYDPFSSDFYSLGVTFLMMKTLRSDIKREEIPKIIDNFRKDQLLSSKIILNLLEENELDRKEKIIIFFKENLNNIQKTMVFPKENDVFLISSLGKDKAETAKEHFQKLYLIASMYHKLSSLTKAREILLEILENIVEKLNSEKNTLNILLYKSYFLLGRVESDLFFYSNKDFSLVKEKEKYRKSAEQIEKSPKILVIQRFEKAFEILSKELINVFTSKAYENEYGDILNELGIAHKNNSNIQKALEYYDKSLELANKLYGVNSYNSASTLHNIGGILLDLGKVEKAQTYFLRSLKITKQIREEDRNKLEEEEKKKLDKEIYNSLISLGLSYIQTNEIELSKEKFEEAYSFSLKTQENVIELNKNLGYLSLQTGKFQEALYHFQKVLEIVQTSEDYNLIGETLNNLALSYSYLKNDKECEEILKKAWDMAVLHKKEYILSETFFNYGNFYFQNGQIEKAEEFFLKTVKIYEENEFENDGLGNIFYNLGIIAINQKNVAKTKKYLNKALSSFVIFFGSEENPKIINIKEILKKL